MTTQELLTMMDDVLAEDTPTTPVVWSDFHATESMKDTALYTMYFGTQY